ncbi:hypothetical protein ACRALDRAFT_209917 [Sodiomyces alcalophilus JCM 7366]|uniref:uncharacterized protein n=1 Tax=Sodiomyces alcalophilus JCM 7366 TaxID=591952 RepID=UPI0039B49486
MSLGWLSLPRTCLGTCDGFNGRRGSWLPAAPRELLRLKLTRQESRQDDSPLELLMSVLMDAQMLASAPLRSYILTSHRHKPLVVFNRHYHTASKVELAPSPEIHEWKCQRNAHTSLSSAGPLVVMTNDHDVHPSPWVRARGIFHRGEAKRREASRPAQLGQFQHTGSLANTGRSSKPSLVRRAGTPDLGDWRCYTTALQRFARTGWPDLATGRGMLKKGQTPFVSVKRRQSMLFPRKSRIRTQAPLHYSLRSPVNVVILGHSRFTARSDPLPWVKHVGVRARKAVTSGVFSTVPPMLEHYSPAFSELLSSSPDTLKPWLHGSLPLQTKYEIRSAVLAIQLHRSREQGPPAKRDLRRSVVVPSFMWSSAKWTKQIRGNMQRSMRTRLLRGSTIAAKGEPLETPRKSRLPGQVMASNETYIDCLTIVVGLFCFLVGVGWFDKEEKKGGRILQVHYPTASEYHDQTVDSAFQQFIQRLEEKNESLNGSSFHASHTYTVGIGSQLTRLGKAFLSRQKATLVLQLLPHHFTQATSPLSSVETFWCNLSSEARACSPSRVSPRPVRLGPRSRAGTQTSLADPQLTNHTLACILKCPFPYSFHRFITTTLDYRDGCGRIGRLHDIDPETNDDAQHAQPHLSRPTWAICRPGPTPITLLRRGVQRGSGAKETITASASIIPRDDKGAFPRRDQTRPRHDLEIWPAFKWECTFPRDFFVYRVTSWHWFTQYVFQDLRPPWHHVSQVTTESLKGQHESQGDGIEDNHLFSSALKLGTGTKVVVLHKDVSHIHPLHLVIRLLRIMCPPKTLCHIIVILGYSILSCHDMLPSLSYTVSENRLPVHPPAKRPKSRIEQLLPWWVWATETKKKSETGLASPDVTYWWQRPTAKNENKTGRTLPAASQ